MSYNSNLKLEIFPDGNSLNHAAAELIIDIANESISARGKFTIVLSGGNTPLELYSLLARLPFRERIEWKKVFVFWGDERCVPLNDSRNNAYQAKLELLDKVAIPAVNIYRIPVNLPPEEAAAEYEKEIKNFFGNETWKFDLTLLGLGSNGHTASIFPGTKSVGEKSIGVKEVYVEEEKMFRVTMTAPLINQSRNVIFLVVGKDKAKTLESVLGQKYQPEIFPAQLIHPASGNLFWFIDNEAAAYIK